MSTPKLEPEKITIIEGPPPTFELALDPWVIGLAEGPALAYTVRCLLRTNNGEALVKRCHDAWKEQRDVFLDYRTFDGENKQALILASKAGEVDDGPIIELWLSLDELPESLANQFLEDDDDFFDEDDDDDDDFEEDGFDDDDDDDEFGSYGEQN